MLDLYPKVIPGPPRPSRILTASSALPQSGKAALCPKHRATLRKSGLSGP